MLNSGKNSGKHKFRKENCCLNKSSAFVQVIRHRKASRSTARFLTHYNCWILILLAWNTASVLYIGIYLYI